MNRSRERKQENYNVKQLGKQMPRKTSQTEKEETKGSRDELQGVRCGDRQERDGFEGEKSFFDLLS